MYQQSNFMNLCGNSGIKLVKFCIKSQICYFVVIIFKFSLFYCNLLF